MNVGPQIPDDEAEKVGNTLTTYINCYLAQNGSKRRGAPSDSAHR